MNRRSFVKGLVAGAGIIVAPEILVPEKKFWQLDKTLWTPDTAYASSDWKVASNAYSWSPLALTCDQTEYLFTLHRYNGRELRTPVYTRVSVCDEFLRTLEDRKAITLIEQEHAFKRCERLIKEKGEAAYA